MLRDLRGSTLAWRRARVVGHILHSVPFSSLFTEVPGNGVLMEVRRHSRGARSSRAWGFEKFDGVAGGVVEQDLLAAEPTHDVVAEVCPRVAKGLD